MLLYSSVGSNFRYTVPNQTFLTPAQLQFYEDNGFLVVRRLVSEENLAKYYDRFQQVCKKEINVSYNELLVPADTCSYSNY